MINLGTVLSDALLRAPLAADIQATPKATLQQMLHLLEEEALSLYGEQVDAVINVTYHTDPNGNAFADGTAVKFAEGQHPATPRRDTADRLQELERLRKEGLVTQGEYEEKRAKILANSRDDGTLGTNSSIAAR